MNPYFRFTGSSHRRRREAGNDAGASVQDTRLCPSVPPPSC